MVRKPFITALFILALLCLNACATIITGKKQVILVQSQPQGAQVSFHRIMAPEFIPQLASDTQDFDESTAPKAYINSQLDSGLSCITPCYISVPRLQKDTLVMTLQKTGYQPVQHKFSKKFNEASLLNFLLPWNWMIDANNGAILRYSQPDTFLLEEVKKRQ